MEDEEYQVPEPELAEDATPIFSSATLIQQSIICLFIILGFTIARQIPWIGSKIDVNYHRAINADADKTFGRLARQPIIRDIVSWAKDGWRSMVVQTTPTTSATIKLTPPVPGEMQREFGWSPSKNSSQEFHAGIDLASPSGRPVRASCDGTVQEVQQDVNGLWHISILHEGNWRTVYANCGSAVVKPGQVVQTGQELGTSANSPVEGEVVHWEVWQGVQPFDPRNFIGS